MRDEWYVARRGQDGSKRYGPLPLRQLCELVEQGRVTGNDLVWREGMDNWQRADECAALFPPEPPPPPRRGPRYDDPRGYDGGRRGFGPYDDDRPYRRPYPPPRSSAAWAVPLAIVGGVFVLFVGCGGLGVVSMLNSSPVYGPPMPVYSPTFTQPIPSVDGGDPADEPNVDQPNPQPWPNPNPPVIVPPDPPAVFVPPSGFVPPPDPPLIVDPPDPVTVNPPDPPLVVDPPDPLIVDPPDPLPVVDPPDPPPVEEPDLTPPGSNFIPDPTPPGSGFTPDPVPGEPGVIPGPP